MDSSRHKLYFIAEATFGTMPATPALTTVRHKGCTLALAKGTMISEEIRSDRQITSFRHGNRQTGGGIQGELSYATFDLFLQAVLCGTWAVKAAAVTALTISAAASDNSINFAAANAPAVETGDLITIAGFTGTAGNNRAGAIVVSRTASKIVISGGAPLVDDAAGESVTITPTTEKLTAGTTRRSFSFLRDFTDQTTAGQHRYHSFLGQEFNKLTIKIAPEAIVTVDFDLVGQNASTPSDTAPVGCTYVDPNTNEPMDSFSGAISEGGSAFALATELTLTLENGLATKPIIGTDLSLEPSIGRSNVSGSLTMHSDSPAQLEKFYAETESSLKLTLADLAGNAYRITLPRIKYNGGQNDANGQGPITPALPFQALLDSTTGTNIIIERGVNAG